MLHTFKCRNFYQTVLSRVCLKKLIDAQLVKKFHAFYRPCFYIYEYLVCLIVLTGASRFTSTLIPLALIPRYKWCFPHHYYLCMICVKHANFRFLGIYPMWHWCRKSHFHFITAWDPAWSGHYELLQTLTKSYICPKKKVLWQAGQHMWGSSTVTSVLCKASLQ